MQTQSILIVEDDPDVRAMLTRTLGCSGYAVDSAVDGAEALDKFRDNRFNLVITDVRLPQMNGLQVLGEIKQAEPRVPVSVITGYGSVQNAVEAMQGGASDYLLKPFSNETLQAAIGRAGLVPQEGSPARPVHGTLAAERRIVTRDPQFLSLLKVAENIAASSATVLVQGESGTGKELLARFIHERGGRRDEPYVAVNCAALPDKLAESELFGHEKEAFTGAVSRKTGKFEAAGRGTIVLDEISEMSPPLQAKLLRVLQERQIDRIGSERPVSMEARVIAVSNIDLKDAVAAGKFREDLFYRVNVVPLTIPPLRERREDIQLLVRHFCEKFGQMNGRQAVVSAAAMDRLLRHSWPGNIRELENTIERAVLMGTGTEIAPQDLILGCEQVTAGSAQSAHVCAGVTVRDMERKLIMTTLQAVNESRSQAAEMLGISIRTLRNKLKDRTESRALDLRSSNHNVIVSNIANADTPNYKAFHVEVEKEMEKFAAGPDRLQMRRTQPAHMPVAAVSEVRGTARVSDTPQFSLRGDGNTVDIDRSMA
ncbi:MAG: flagellar basal body rod protein FlgB, partial [Desulfobacterales bacterium]